jgi:hypothetical protein
MSPQAHQEANGSRGLLLTLSLFPSRVTQFRNCLFLDSFFQLREGGFLLTSGPTNEPEKPYEHECPRGHPSQRYFGEVHNWLYTDVVLCYDDCSDWAPSRTTPGTRTTTSLISLLI